MTGNPAGLDGLVVDALMLPLYEQRRQPLGVAGFVDWRLSGRLGRMIKKGTFAGREGESVLTSALGRLGARRIFLYGLGEPRPRTRVEWTDTLEKMFRILSDAKAEDVALATPELGTADRARLSGEDHNVDALEIVRAWIAAKATKDAPFERLVLLDARGELERARKDLRELGQKSGLDVAGA
jgi:hypothetical protein